MNKHSAFRTDPFWGLGVDSAEGPPFTGHMVMVKQMVLYWFSTKWYHVLLGLRETLFLIDGKVIPG